ncbi:MAG TPA: maleylpyruvate isomerase family mycothiol-dependent enzyme [Acidimicrobiales bacterium]|nr:maleylpyruvate isomerase family mycothiol-dependent enzyme [Acidimicrobiales bacterium]
MAPDYEQLLWEQMHALADLAAQLGPDDWDHPSLCEGWRVRDVYGHMCVGHTYPLPKLLAKVAASGFDVDKGSARESAAWASAHSPAEITATIASIAENRTRKGISRFIPDSDGYVDHVIHELDVRRPLGRPRELAAETKVAALGAMTLKQGGGTKPKKRMEGLRFVATDADWSTGDGPEVRGTTEALLLGLANRDAALGELEGDGAATFAGRVGTPA